MNGFCFLSAVAMRREASHTSEMVSQLIFGDGVEILERRPEWVRVMSLYDGYDGWVSDKQVEMMAQLPQMDYVVPSDSKVRYGDRVVDAPAGASCKREWLLQPEQQTIARSVEQVCESLLHTPYLWGGRTRMGIDCSGFTQIVYKICGRKLPRDAWQQAMMEWGKVSVAEAKSGDLAFFSNDKGRIVHVGIVAGRRPELMLYHASGEVRCDTLTNEGIWNRERGCYTHTLAFILAS